MTCPGCGRTIPGLGYWCPDCEEYTVEPGARRSPPWTFTLDLPPNLANGRMHWAEKGRKQAAYVNGCDRRYPVDPALTLPKAEAVITLYVHQTMDRDNAFARCKWTLDWLVRRGYVVDDSPDCLRLEVRQEVDRKNQRIEVSLGALREAKEAK